MMIRLLQIAVVVASLLLLLCAGGHAQDGAKIFEGKGNCWTCHGRDGRGTPLGPDLTDAVWLNVDGSLDSIRFVIRTGVTRPKKHPAPMPAMGGAKLSGAEIDAVARYVLTLADTAMVRDVASAITFRDQVRAGAAVRWCGLVRSFRIMRRNSHTRARSQYVVGHDMDAAGAAGRCWSDGDGTAVRRCSGC